MNDADFTHWSHLWLGLERRILHINGSFLSLCDAVSITVLWNIGLNVKFMQNVAVVNNLLQIKTLIKSKFLKTSCFNLLEVTFRLIFEKY